MRSSVIKRRYFLRAQHGKSPATSYGLELHRSVSGQWPTQQGKPQQLQDDEEEEGGEGSEDVVYARRATVLDPFEFTQC